MNKSMAFLLRELEKGPVHIGKRESRKLAAARELVKASTIFRLEEYGTVMRLLCSGQGTIKWI